MTVREAAFTDMSDTERVAGAGLGNDALQGTVTCNPSSFQGFPCIMSAVKGGRLLFPSLCACNQSSGSKTLLYK